MKVPSAQQFIAGHRILLAVTEFLHRVMGAMVVEVAALAVTLRLAMVDRVVMEVQVAL